MTALHVIALAVVALTGTIVVLVRDPLRQAMAAGVFGLALAILFFAFQAPDVAFSEIVVATAAVPLMVLLALAKIREDDESREP
jgi:energy-converting hydrogenase B subunit D